MKFFIENMNIENICFPWCEVQCTWCILVLILACSPIFEQIYPRHARMPVEHILLLESPVMDKGTMDTGMHACIMMHDACMYQDHASCPGFGGSGICRIWGSRVGGFADMIFVKIFTLADIGPITFYPKSITRNILHFGTKQC